MIHKTALISLVLCRVANSASQMDDTTAELFVKIPMQELNPYQQQGDEPQLESLTRLVTKDGAPVLCPGLAFGQTWSSYGGQYCIHGDLYYCSSPNNPGFLTTPCNNGCITNQANVPDICKTKASSCQSTNCFSCTRTPGCNWDPNWLECRTIQQCDYFYRPKQRQAALEVSSYNVPAITACLARSEQCFDKNPGPIIDKNPFADSCSKHTNCGDCTTAQGCIFNSNTGRCWTGNLYECQTPGVACYQRQCPYEATYPTYPTSCSDFKGCQACTQNGCTYGFASVFGPAKCLKSDDTCSYRTNASPSSYGEFQSAAVAMPVCAGAPNECRADNGFKTLVGHRGQCTVGPNSFDACKEGCECVRIGSHYNAPGRCFGSCAL